MATRVVAEVLEVDGADQQDEVSLLSGRAAMLAGRRPDLVPLLVDFVASQQAEYDYLEEHTIDVTWVLSRR